MHHISSLVQLQSDLAIVYIKVQHPPLCDCIYEEAESNPCIKKNHMEPEPRIRRNIQNPNSTPEPLSIKNLN